MASSNRWRSASTSSAEATRAGSGAASGPPASCSMSRRLRIRASDGGDDLVQGPAPEQGADDPPAHGLGGQGLPPGESEQGPDEPHEGGHRRGSDQGQEPARAKKTEQSLHDVAAPAVAEARVRAGIRVISTRRFLASLGFSGTRGSVSARPSVTKRPWFAARDLDEHGRD